MKLREKLNALKAAKAAYHEKAHTLTPSQIAEESAKFKASHAEINALLTDGAKDCPDCGGKPFALFHDGTPNPFEIGCVTCRNHRVRAALPEDAVADWNNDKYLPPRDPGTAVATHRDVTGEVKSQKTVKLQGT